MTLAFLAAFAAAAGWLAPAALIRLRWLARTPRLAVAAWLLTVAGLFAAAVGIGVAATLPLISDVGGLREFVHRCPQWLAAIRSHPGPLTLAILGAALVACLAAAAVWSVLAQLRQLRVDARHHLELLIATGQSHRALAVVPDPRPAAWSLAADKGHVVLTSAAVSTLTADELTAVVAHETAHLHGRHHLLLAITRAAQLAVPCPLTRLAAVEVAQLLEMRADDVAAARTHPDTVAMALLRLTAVLPAGALGAGGGETAVRRLRRLVEPAPASRGRAGLAALSAVGAVVVPIAVTGAATATVLSLHFCPLP